MSEIYYEVQMTRVLHTARISNVDSVMFVDRNKRDGLKRSFEQERMGKDVSFYELGTSMLKPKPNIPILGMITWYGSLKGWESGKAEFSL